MSEEKFLKRHVAVMKKNLEDQIDHIDDFEQTINQNERTIERLTVEKTNVEQKLQNLSICVEKLGPLENEVLQLRSDISKLEAANKQLKREAEADQHHRQILIFDNAKLLQDVVLSQQKYITSEESLQKALKKDDDNLQLLLDERMKQQEKEALNQQKLSKLENEMNTLKGEHAEKEQKWMNLLHSKDEELALFCGQSTGPTRSLASEMSEQKITELESMLLTRDQRFEQAIRAHDELLQKYAVAINQSDQQKLQIFQLETDLKFQEQNLKQQLYECQHVNSLLMDDKRRHMAESESDKINLHICREQIGQLEREVSTKDTTIDALNCRLARKDAEISKLKAYRERKRLDFSSTSTSTSILTASSSSDIKRLSFARRMTSADNNKKNEAERLKELRDRNAREKPHNRTHYLPETAGMKDGISVDGTFTTKF